MNKEKVIFTWVHLIKFCKKYGLQEWPEEVYPPYANGPGYILSSDIAEYVASKFKEHKLRVSKLPTSFNNPLYVCGFWPDLNGK